MPWPARRPILGCGAPPASASTKGQILRDFRRPARYIDLGTFPSPDFFQENIAMWIPKWQRDHKKGVDSPVPTQVVSNEEFIPRPQNAKQQEVERLIGVMAEEKSRQS
jgi:hypothetical protein